jgi:TM2 domain-containing membrane protein YozV
MAADWYYSHDGERHGPVAVEQIKEMAAAGTLRRDDLVWQEGMADWTPAGRVPGLLSTPGGPPPMPSRVVSAYPADANNRSAIQAAQGTKMAAGICGILVGGLGVHKFVYGATTAGVIMLLVSLLSCGIGYPVMHIIGLVEGIIYLTKSDEEFYQTYVVDKKAWF